MSKGKEGDPWSVGVGNWVDTDDIRRKEVKVVVQDVLEEGIIEGLDGNWVTFGQRSGKSVHGDQTFTDRKGLRYVIILVGFPIIVKEIQRWWRWSGIRRGPSVTGILRPDLNAWVTSVRIKTDIRVPDHHRVRRVAWEREIGVSNKRVHTEKEILTTNKSTTKSTRNLRSKKP